jgi:hypothetical protein
MNTVKNLMNTPLDKKLSNGAGGWKERRNMDNNRVNQNFPSVHPKFYSVYPNFKWRWIK